MTYISQASDNIVVEDEQNQAIYVMVFLLRTKLRLSFNLSFDPLSSQFSMLIKRDNARAFCNSFLKYDSIHDTMSFCRSK